MNRMMMERSIELALGNVLDAARDRHLRCKAKAVGMMIDANLIAEDAGDWIGDRTRGIRNVLAEGAYAVSDAADDIDYILFKDNNEARRATLMASGIGMGLLATIMAALRIGHKRNT